MAFPIIRGPAEHIFGVQEISFPGPEMRVQSRTRRWSEGVGGEAPVGVLGVPVDNATGYAVIAGAPPGHWSVTTELSLDVFGSVPTDGGDLVASAALVDSNGSTGFAEGHVTDAHGTTLARVRQRGHFVAGLPELGRPASGTRTGPVPDGLATYFGVGPIGRRRPGAVEITVGAPLANPLGNLHGGVALCLAEWMAGESLVETTGGRLRTTSIHVAYLRPASLGTTLRVSTEVQHAGRSFTLSQVTASLPNGKPAFIAWVARGAR